MELCDTTLSILKNFAGINSNLVVQEGNVLRTIAEGKNILAECEVKETFPQAFGLYDLNEFLGVIGLVSSPRLTFKKGYVLINDTSGRSSIKYYFSDPDMLTYSSKQVRFPENPEIEFDLDADTLSKIKRAASVLGHNEVAIKGKSGETIVELQVVDSENSTSNVYTIDVPGEYPEVNFSFYVAIANLKMLPGDYKVNIVSRSGKKIIRLIGKDTKVVYYIAPEEKSTYGE